MMLAAAIFNAVRDGDGAAVSRLLREDPHLVRAADEHLKTPLHWAAERDQVAIAAVLLDAGADFEAVTSWGATPFDWAATMGSTQVADLLLARGAQGLNLVAAASLGKLDLVRACFHSGEPLSSHRRRAVPAEPDEYWVADSACMQGDVISDAFHGACRNGHAEVAAWLLERGADVNAKGVFGGTALHWAAINGHKETVLLLSAHGANRAIRDAKFDATPAEWAAEGKHDEICTLLRGAEYPTSSPR